MFQTLFKNSVFQLELANTILCKCHNRFCIVGGVWSCNFFLSLPTVALTPIAVGGLLGMASNELWEGTARRKFVLSSVLVSGEILSAWAGQWYGGRNLLLPGGYGKLGIFHLEMMPTSVVYSLFCWRIYIALLECWSMDVQCLLSSFFCLLPF